MGEWTPKMLYDLGKRAWHAGGSTSFIPYTPTYRQKCKLMTEHGNLSFAVCVCVHALGGGGSDVFLNCLMPYFKQVAHRSRVHWSDQTSLLASPRNSLVSCSPGITDIYCYAWKSHLSSSKSHPTPLLCNKDPLYSTGLTGTSKRPCCLSLWSAGIIHLHRPTQLGFLFMPGRKQYMYFLNDNHPGEHRGIINHTGIDSIKEKTDSSWLHWSL